MQLLTLRWAIKLAGLGITYPPKNLEGHRNTLFTRVISQSASQSNEKNITFLSPRYHVRLSERKQIFTMRHYKLKLGREAGVERLIASKTTALF